MALIGVFSGSSAMLGGERIAGAAAAASEEKETKVAARVLQWVLQWVWWRRSRFDSGSQHPLGKMKFAGALSSCQ